MANWRPKKEGQKYYFPSIYFGTAYAGFDIWSFNRLHGDRYRAGMVCRTKKEALELAEKMLEVTKGR